MNKVALNLALAAVSLSCASGANALLFQPTNTGTSVGNNLDQVCALFVCSNVQLDVDIHDLDLVSNSLSVGDIWSFDFFDVTASGWGIAEVGMTADLAFASPGGSSSHHGNGVVGTLGGVISGGKLLWDDPATVALGDGTLFRVWLDDVLEFGFGNTTTVMANVKLLADPTSVPEPGTLTLLGAGLLMLPYARRRLLKKR